MSKRPRIRWLDEPEKSDYTAAKSYLELIYEVAAASKFVDQLKDAGEVDYKAKDIFRASRLPLLGMTNSHVKKDQKKIVAGKKLSPLLLVRDTKNGNVIIADGYHRMCAVYSFDEDATIPCRIA